MQSSLLQQSFFLIGCLAQAGQPSAIIHGKVIATVQFPVPALNGICISDVLLQISQSCNQKNIKYAIIRYEIDINKHDAFLLQLIKSKRFKVLRHQLPSVNLEKSIPIFSESAPPVDFPIWKMVSGETKLELPFGQSVPVYKFISIPK